MLNLIIQDMGDDCNQGKFAEANLFADICQKANDQPTFISEVQFSTLTTYIDPF